MTWRRGKRAGDAAAWRQVGYGDEVVFADGSFIDGSTLELSADGPLRPPFVAYCQVPFDSQRVALRAERGVMRCRAVRSVTAAAAIWTSCP